MRGSLNLHMVEAAGRAARVQGMRRYSALLLRRGQAGQGKAQLVKALDGDILLAETGFDWEMGETHEFSLSVSGNQVSGSIDGQTLFTVTDDNPLDGGGVAFVVEEGRIMSEGVEVTPLA